MVLAPKVLRGLETIFNELNESVTNKNEVSSIVRFKLVPLLGSIFSDNIQYNNNNETSLPYHAWDVVKTMANKEGLYYYNYVDLLDIHKALKTISPGTKSKMFNSFIVYGLK